MKVIVAGTRTITSGKVVFDAIAASGFEVTEVVSGGAQGVDWLGETWAAANDVPVTVFRAQWRVLGRRAGPVRNRQMAQYADALVAVWDGSSRGTQNMIDEATKRGLKVYVERVPQ